MRLSRRGLILGGSALLAGCSSAASTSQLQLAGAVAPTLPILPERTAATHVQVADTGTAIDPHGIVRKDLIERARAAMDVHGHKISKRDRMYLVDFQKFSGEDRFYEVDLEGGWVTAYRTSHGRGSDPAHSGYAQQFSNRPDSHMSSIGAYATAGASWGSQQGPNVLLDGLEYSNNLARERAIIIHGADYADPAFLARQGKLGRSYGCFSVSHADLIPLRERMGEGRLLFAMT
ncbi:murein L,D-transpeptidase catalytic domain-containing protein [Brevundimonas guildfordensis]|uniref:Murein L,D-transpeptidase catalytic domain family protein n=1 Tax=Brevundimonas guildfordensis TaxID=2762241 RepID=A0ABR8QZT5_9CAUL|nr:murein L,D-transpeptidase catalytic domain family protein [Brevundimonas guildfordensis]MBD7941040.1 murein L,D-transpeptidase catalytic domain family protein [Brevundimonas guildfordensis]